MAAQYGGTGTRTASLSVNEPEIYRKGSEHSFFADMAFRFQEPDAMDRISRHQRARRASAAEQRASSSSGNFGGMVIPAYLVDEFAPIAREGRPFANTVRGRELPPTGMTWTIPKGNTATLVGSQTTENTAVATQTYTVADLSGPIVTVAGSIAVSRQSLDRGTNVDMIVMEDLAGAYAAELDRPLIHGAGTNNTHYGILATTSVSTLTVTQTGATTQLRQVAQAIGQVHEGRKRAASVIVVHPRRWAYWLRATDTTNRPLITAEGNGPFNVFGQGQFSDDLIAGTLHGLPVILDANISTTLSYDVTQSSTTDIVIVTRASDLILMEDNSMPTQVRYEETLSSNLSVNIVAWGYSGFTAGRYPSATVVLAGSGMTIPATVG
jgi:HK97 family phage major capsid protein